MALSIWVSFARRTAVRSRVVAGMEPPPCEPRAGPMSPQIAPLRDLVSLRFVDRRLRLLVQGTRIESRGRIERVLAFQHLRDLAVAIDHEGHALRVRAAGSLDSVCAHDFALRIREQ